MKSMHTVKSPKYPVEPMNIESAAIIGRNPAMPPINLQRNYFSSGQNIRATAVDGGLKKSKKRARKNIPNSMTFRAPSGQPNGLAGAADGLPPYSSKTR